MKILISGGHLTPALAVCDYIQAHQPEVDLVFVGRVYSQDAVQQKSQEQAELKQRHIPFVAFSAPRLSEPGWWHKLMCIPQFVTSFIKALQIMVRHRPSVFLSFGGYLALPLALAAFMCRVPIVTHEQTRAMGEANKLIAKIARQVAVSFPETAAQVSAHKVVVTGNPIRPELLLTTPRQPAWLPSKMNKPLLYITGGNQGSHVINTVIGEVLPKLVTEWCVVHQCGNPTTVVDYKKSLEKQRRLLDTELQANYIIKEWISSSELNWLYRHATGVLSRSGANTVVELAALRVPSILVPLPYSHHDEQQLNAEWLEKTGGALVLPQRELTSDSLWKMLRKLKRSAPAMKSLLADLAVPLQADQALWQVVVSCVN